MQRHECVPLIPVIHGRGVWLYDTNGSRYLDAISSWWVNLFGYANPRISAPLKDQLDRLEHAKLAGFTHEPAIIAASDPNAQAEIFWKLMNHASLIDGTRLSRTPERVNPHGDTTASAPALAHALLASLDIIGGAEGAARRLHLNALIAQLQDELRPQRWRLLASQTAIQPLVIGAIDEAMAVAAKLYSQGLWVPAIRQPTVPPNAARLRITLSAAHAAKEATIDERLEFLRVEGGGMSEKNRLAYFITGTGIEWNADGNARHSLSTARCSSAAYCSSAGRHRDRTPAYPFLLRSGLHVGECGGGRRHSRVSGALVGPLRHFRSGATTRFAGDYGGRVAARLPQSRIADSRSDRRARPATGWQGREFRRAGNEARTGQHRRISIFPVCRTRHRPTPAAPIDLESA
jgi:hypothetical protein